MKSGMKSGWPSWRSGMIGKLENLRTLPASNLSLCYLWREIRFVWRDLAEPHSVQASMACTASGGYCTPRRLTS